MWKWWSQLLAVFQGFLGAETGEPAFVLLHKLSHGLPIGPRVVAESPANGLADEELFLVGRLQTQLE